MDIWQIIDDISLHIFKFLPINDICSLGLVNKMFNRGYSNEIQWKTLLERDYMDDYINVMEDNNYGTYKSCFRIDCLMTLFSLSKTTDTYIFRPCNRPFSKKISFSVSQYLNITNINMGYNKLESLPIGICLLKNLENLDLHNNCLETLPSEFGLLTKLRKLDLEYNNLKSLPVELFKLTNLESLDVKNNNLKTLPPEIIQLVKLKSFNLSYNCLEKLPSHFDNLVNLGFI